MGHYVASGRLKLTLTGHVESVRGLAVSQRHTYMYSAGEDKQIKCWDLEQNKARLLTLTHHKKSVRALALHTTEIPSHWHLLTTLKKLVFRKESFYTTCCDNESL